MPAEDLDPTWRQVPATGRLGTYTTLLTAVGSRITASGELFTAHPGRTMTVTLFKKVGSTWQKVSTTTPTLGAFGTYSTSFAVPAASSCKVVAWFAGDADHLAQLEVTDLRLLRTGG